MSTPVKVDKKIEKVNTVSFAVNLIQRPPKKNSKSGNKNKTKNKKRKRKSLKNNAREVELQLSSHIKISGENTESTDDKITSVRSSNLSVPGTPK
jgi:hypothetical protein